LTEAGVNPEALAALVKELRRQKEYKEEVPHFFNKKGKCFQEK
jgi:hypothetical protein